MATTITRPDGKTLEAIVSATNTNKPALIIVQEWWGINEQMKKRALKFEAAGFRTILPDLYHGKSAEIGKTEEAKHLYSALDWPGAVSDLEACIQFALSTGSPKVALTGYCMGGALTLMVAAKNTQIAAIVPFYGLPPDTVDLSTIQCPVQGHYAEHDDWCNPQKVDAQLTKKLKVEHEILTYQGAHHAFTNEARTEVYDAKACEISLDRTLVFLGKHLF
jgi:carboxymethylenebutenolidase